MTGNFRILAKALLMVNTSSDGNIQPAQHLDCDRHAKSVWETGNISLPAGGKTGWFGAGFLFLNKLEQFTFWFPFASERVRCDRNLF